MSKQTEALKLALEALEAYRPVIVKRYGLTYSVGDSAATAIREALASGASEESSGVAQPDRHELQKDGKHPAPCARFCEAAAFNIEIRGLRKRLTEQPAQRQARSADTWVGLTDEDIQEVRENCGITHHAIKTIEAKLREKNT